MERASLGVLVIATGRYLEFAEQLLTDLERELPPSQNMVVNLFTDAAPKQLGALAKGRLLRLNPLPVAALRWPEASLLRYELFTQAADEIQGDLLVYLDADLRVLRDFTPMLTPHEWPGGMAAVRHPGFYRPHQFRPRGTWETRRLSQAYVAPWRRRHYVCGGVWMGQREALFSVSELLANRVRVDAAAGVTARWHDESHWNWWVAHHRVQLLEPSWCWVPDYPWLAQLEPFITAVDKGATFIRETTPDRVRRQVMGVGGPE